jgi:hypothetical protein
MRKTTFVLLSFGLITLILISGCSTSVPYPTQTVTVIGKYEEKGIFNEPLYFIIDHDGNVAEIHTGSVTNNKYTWDSMKIGTTYVCDLTTGGANGVFQITRIVTEVQS